jgi:hypothetical protein
MRSVADALSGRPDVPAPRRSVVAKQASSYAIGPFAAVAAALLAISCTSAPLVGASRDAETDWSSYQSFHVNAPPRVAPAHARYNDVVGQAVLEEISLGMIDHGLHKADKKEADLEISFAVGDRVGVDIIASNRRNTPAIPYISGHLSVGVFDRKSGRMVWHGWAELRLHKHPPRGAELTREVTRNVISRYPNAGGKQ